jgi:AcrR family transcriptional regulator
MKSGTKRKLTRTRTSSTELREQVLQTFSTNAKRFGIRPLLMTELASELRMSVSTLYKMFPSKELLALACVERWADELGAAEAAQHDPSRPRDDFEQYLHWIEAWADANANLSPAFSRDLKSEYPAVWKRYCAVMEDRKQRGAKLLRPLLRADVDERVAFALLNSIFATVLEHDFAERLRTSRREALRSAILIWAGGALERRPKLRNLRSGANSRPRS